MNFISVMRSTRRLVRGLDYYCHTTFEFVTDRLGAQGTLLAGGRYDGDRANGRPADPRHRLGCRVERLMMLTDGAFAPLLVRS